MVDSPYTPTAAEAAPRAAAARRLCARVGDEGLRAIPIAGALVLVGVGVAQTARPVTSEAGR